MRLSSVTVCTMHCSQAKLFWIRLLVFKYNALNKSCQLPIPKVIKPKRESGENIRYILTKFAENFKPEINKPSLLEANA